VAHKAFERFYDANGSRHFVKRYAVMGNSFYSKYMSKYSKEVREMNGVPFQGIITPRGVMR